MTVALSPEEVGSQSEDATAVAPPMTTHTTPLLAGTHASSLLLRPDSERERRFLGGLDAIYRARLPRAYEREIARKIVEAFVGGNAACAPHCLVKSNRDGGMA